MFNVGFNQVLVSFLPLFAVTTPLDFTQIMTRIEKACLQHVNPLQWKHHPNVFVHSTIFIHQQRSIDAKQ